MCQSLKLSRPVSTYILCEVIKYSLDKEDYPIIKIALRRKESNLPYKGLRASASRWQHLSRAISIPTLKGRRVLLSQEGTEGSYGFNTSANV